jgi:hypothetical protein
MIAVYQVLSATKHGSVCLTWSGYMSLFTADGDSCWLFGIPTLPCLLWFFAPKWQIPTNMKSETLNEGCWHCVNPPVSLDKVSKDN